MTATRIVYLHGFLSSPASLKARLLAQYLLGREVQLAVPDIPPDPQLAIEAIEDAMADAPRVTFIGSSLGGYYATYLAEKHQCRAVLVNPAVRPYELLKNFLGAQRNFHTGTEFMVTPGHLDALRQFEVAQIANPERYLILLETGDEVLDYRLAVARYRGARQIVIEGGDHSFQNFARYLPLIAGFAKA